MNGRSGYVLRGQVKGITDGLFPEVKGVLGGYWMIQVGPEEAVEWASCCQASDN